MKTIGTEGKASHFSKFGTMLQVAAMGGLFIAAGFILAGPAPAPPPRPVEPQFAIDLSSSDRYLTHVATDKPIYRTGEKLYVRGVVLSASGHTPRSGVQGANGAANFEIKGPKGDTVATGFSTIIDSVTGFSWDIPAGQAGGEYTVRIFYPNGDAPAERKFDIRAYRAPRLKSQIVFVRDGYGPGDTVSANLHVERAEGGIPARAKVSVSARVDGEEVWKGETTVDSSGNAGASFKLPGVIARGEGVIGMTIEDGGIVETATKTVPILLQTVDLSIYPEGGDLIAGLSNRVYLEGRTPAKKPADMAGIIVNSAGREVATFRTEHEGRGRFTFVPAKGETYSLHVSEPAGIKTVFPLPSVKESGVVLSSISNVTARQKDVALRIAATTSGDYGVALTQRGKEFAFKSVSLTANRPTNVAFTLPRSLDGVIVATVYDDNKTPMAERLIFRQPEHGLKVQVSADRIDYVPGDRVTLRVTTTDDTGKPVGAMVGLTVTDSSVLEMIEKREQAPSLPVMVLLESDVRNLSDAHVYLDESNPKAPLATDLLLGTQGWRRFATLDPAKFLAAYNDGARRVLAIGALPNVQPQVSGRVLETDPLSGVVSDSSGALIPGVTVRAVNTATDVIVARLTNESGAYAFPILPPGPYLVIASLNGFQTKTVTGLEVKANTSLRQNIQLQIGRANGNVEVALAADLLRASAATVGVVLPQARIQDLPNGGGNVIELIQVLPALQKDEAAQMKRDMVDDFRFAPAPINGQGQAGRGGAGGGRAAGPAVAQGALRGNPFTVREYAHVLRPNWTEGSRVDFAETLYWNAGVRTDASTGTANVSFNLSDSVTSFRVLADGFAQDGSLGSAVSHVESVQPFSIEPKIPLQVTSGDVIQLPVAVVNGMSRELRAADFSIKGAAGLNFTMLGDGSSTLRAKERTRRVVQIDVSRDFSGMANLTLDAKAGPYHDSVGRTLDVQPLGFPHQSSAGGVLERNGSKSFEFTLPGEIVRGSLSSSVTVYPTPLASMTEALQSLLREPNGCFEQTSSTSYPMVMAQQYFLTHTGIDASIVEKTKNLLEVSYKRLTGFESHSKGYEWFGADPGHEALTAYGLMQFTDMSQVRSVDKDMVNRTRGWLLSHRDGKGGFNLNSKALDSFGRAPADTTNAYITWALIESGEKALAPEIAFVKASANSSEDSYIVALGANILNASGDRSGAHQLMDKLARSQESAGSVKGAVTSITRSGGDALTIETTALSVLAWLRDPAYAGNVDKGLRWIVEANKNGRFGSTQSTILALRSIVAYDSANARPKAPGRIVLTLDGRPVGAPLAFSASTQGALVLPEFASELGPGKHQIALRMEDGSNMPFSIAVKYYSTLPDSAEQTQIGIQVALKDKQIQEGGVTEAMVSIANKSEQAIPTPVAIVGIPGGLEVRHDQLKELVKSGRIDAYEVIGREVVLYWRYIKAKDRFELPLSLIAAVPGTYTGPASRAYLYYTDEYKNWAPGLKVSITAR